MTKEKFKQRWESNDLGGGITFDDIAQCAVEWGLCFSPRTKPIGKITYLVLRHARTNDAEDFKPLD